MVVKLERLIFVKLFRKLELILLAADRRTDERDQVFARRRVVQPYGMGGQARM